MNPLLEFKQIGKSFSGVRVLSEVTLSVQPGETLGLVGENGAGKSTLMNILGGNLKPDSGEMRWNGQPFQPSSPRDSELTGIAFIHQELNLFPNLSIAENLFLSHFPKRWGAIDKTRMIQRSRDLLQRVGLKLSPHLKVHHLSTGERQLVEIAKAINLQARLIIFDEPTTSLASHEVRRLFDLISSLKSQNVSIIYISHTLDDVLSLADAIAVLRDGQVVANGPKSDFDVRKLVSRMVGRELDDQYPPYQSRIKDKPLLVVKELSQPGVVRDINFSLMEGEVLGISGLMGSGRTELARILLGLDSMSGGQITLDGQPIQAYSIRQRIQCGMAMLTESRRDDGLFLEGSIRDNAVLVAAKRFSHALTGIFRRSAMNAAAGATLTSVTLPNGTPLHRAVGTLSGGNQQKVVLAKWLMNRPKVLILDEPTRGVDVGAKYEIYLTIQRLAREGAGILVISSELEELIGICDRILVMNHGEINDELDRSEFDRERILQASIRSTALRPEAV